MEESDQEEKKLCSNCKRLISASVFVTHEAHCRRHLALCEVCDEPVPVQEMERHHQENHALTPCDRCGARLPRDQLEEHVEGQCPERSVECKYCELEVKAGEYDTHIDACGSRTDYCDKCNVRVMLKDMEEHKLAKCGDLKAVEFSEEPTLENLPPSYMDGYNDMNPPGGTSQGPLIGGGDSEYLPPRGGLGLRLLSFGPGFLEGHAIFYGGATRDRGTTESSQEENVELDREWLEEVGGVCQGEDLDRMMAQAIALEDKRQATSRDHLFGIDSRVLREGHYASTFRDMEEQRAENDANMARRLQSTYDHEYNTRQADENLARQLNEEQEEGDNVTPPPISPRQSPPLTSVTPPPDYRATIQREGEEEGEREEREREREKERLTDLEQQQKRVRYRSPERQRGEDLLLAERLQREEHNHFKTKLNREMGRTHDSRREGAHLEGGEVEESAGGSVDNERFALRLQREEIQRAERELREYKRKQGLPEDNPLDGASRGRPGGEHDDSQSELEEGHQESPPPPSPCPPPPPSSPGHTPGYDGLPTLEPYDDSEQPRLKPIPRPHPPEEEDDKIPCQFCREVFPFDVIMDHQRYCTADLRVPSVRGRGSRAVEVDLAEVLRDEEEDRERERNAGATCKYCNESFPRAFIDPHQALCDQNPDKALKHAYKPHPTRQGMNPTHSKNIPAIQHEEVEEEDMLPCEYCQASFPPRNVLSHQAVCDKRPRPRHGNTPQLGRGEGGESAGGSSGSEVIPCQYCSQPIPITQFIKHEAVCRFQRFPPSSSTSPTSFLSQPTTTALSITLNSPPQRSVTQLSTQPTPLTVTATSSSKPPHRAMVNNPPQRSVTQLSTQSTPLTVMATSSSKPPHRAIAQQSSHTTAVSEPSAQPTTFVVTDTVPHTVRPHSTTQTATNLNNKPLHRPAPHRSIAAVFPSHPTATPVSSSMTDDQKTALIISSTHPTSTTTTGGSSSDHPPSQTNSTPSVRGSFSSAVHPVLPPIYMYTSTSQPHSVEDGGKVGEGKSRAVPVTHDVKVQQEVEVVANRRSPQPAAHIGTTSLGTGTTSHDIMTSSHDTGTTSHHNEMTLSHDTETPSHDSGSLSHDTGMTLSRDAPATTAINLTQYDHTVTVRTPHSFGIVTPRGPSLQNNQPLPRARPDRQIPNHTILDREHLPPSLIGSDSTIVRPTRSDIVAVQRQLQHMVPTPIPMPTSDLMSNPLKIATSGMLPFGNLPVIPPISSDPSSKKNSKTGHDKTFYNVPVNTPSMLLDTDKGGVKMPAPLIQKQMPVLDMPVLVPALVQNPDNTSKESSSLKDMRLVKGPLSKQLNLVNDNLSKGKGKEVLDTIKITADPPTISNLSPEISLSSLVSHDSSPVIGTDKPPQFPHTADTNSDETEALPSSNPPFAVTTRESRESSISPVNSTSTGRENLHISSTASDSPLSVDEGDSSDSESSATLTSTSGPLVEYTGTYTGELPLTSDVGEESLPPNWVAHDDGGVVCGASEREITQLEQVPSIREGQSVERNPAQTVSHGVLSAPSSRSQHSHTNSRTKSKVGVSIVISRHRSPARIKTHQTPSSPKSRSKQQQTTSSTRQKQTVSSPGGTGKGQQTGRGNTSTPSKQNNFSEPSGQRTRVTSSKQRTSQNTPSPKSSDTPMRKRGPAQAGIASRMTTSKPRRKQAPHSTKQATGHGEKK